MWYSDIYDNNGDKDDSDGPRDKTKPIQSMSPEYPEDDEDGEDAEDTDETIVEDTNAENTNAEDERAVNNEAEEVRAVNNEAEEARAVNNEAEEAEVAEDAEDAEDTNAEDRRAGNDPRPENVEDVKAFVSRLNDRFNSLTSIVQLIELRQQMLFLYMRESFDE